MYYLKAREYLLAKPEAQEDFPFGPDVMVFRVKEKMFATLSQGKNTEHYWMNVKCEPQQALILRDMFESVIPGYHMNKKHWNTVILDGTIPKHEVERMIDHSYTLIAKSLKKVERMQLELHYPQEQLYK